MKYYEDKKIDFYEKETLTLSYVLSKYGKNVTIFSNKTREKMTSFLNVITYFYF